MTINYKTEWYEKTKPNYKDFDADSPYWDMKYRDRYSMMLEHLSSSTYTTGNKPYISINTETPKILEIGCGLGRALSYFKRFGASVKGVEPSDYAVSNSRLAQDEIIHSDYMQASIEEKFDVIHVEQVLSHMPDYLVALVKAYDLLKDDGIIVIEEPNDFNALQKILEPKYGRYWVTEDHCNYFNFDSMELALKTAGFEVIHRYCTFPMELFALEGFEYIGNDEVGKQVHRMRYNQLSQMNYHQRKESKECFASFGLGRDLVVTARKYHKGGIFNG